MVVFPAPLIVPPFHVRPPLKVALPAPANVPPDTVTAPAKLDACATLSVPVMFSASAELTLSTDCAPATLIVGLAATLIVTASPGPGMTLLLQLPAWFQLVPSPRPVHWPLAIDCCVMLNAALLISKKMLPTASILMRTLLALMLGTVTSSDPSFAVLAASTVGNVFPLSVESEIFTFVTLMPLPVVPATFHATLSVESPSRLAAEFELVMRNPAPVFA